MNRTRGIAVCVCIYVWVPSANASEDITTVFWDSVLHLITRVLVPETFVTTQRVTLTLSSSLDSISAFPISKHHQTAPSTEFGFADEYLAQYATYRSPGEVYLHGKAGYAWDSSREKDLWRTGSLDEMVDEFGTNGAFGLGAGYRLNNGRRLEIEYSVNRHDEQLFRVGYTF